MRDGDIVDFDYQGKRKDQVESSFKMVGFSFLVLLASVIIGILLS